MEDKINIDVSKKVWMMKKNDGLEQSMEDKKIMIFQRKYGWWKKNHGLDRSMEDKKNDGISKKV